MRVLAALPIAILLGWPLSACTQTPRPPLMSPLAQVVDYGYADRDLGNDKVEVTYLGPSYRVSTSRSGRQQAVDQATQQAEELATWRAAQIALARGKPAFEVVDRHTGVEVDIRDHYDPYPFWGPFGYPYYPYYWARAPFYSPWPAFGRYRDAYAQAEAKLTVKLLDEKKPGALDARETAERLSRKYGPPAGQTAPAPGSKDALPRQDY